MNGEPSLGQIHARTWAARLASTWLCLAGLSPSAAAGDDVLLQTMSGKIVTGIVDDSTFVGTLGQRVHRERFLSNSRSANPGFVALPTGSPSMPPGAAGFPSLHDVDFDLLPMTIEEVTSNLFYWDGSDLDGDGLDFSDVDFVVPTGVSWEVFDANFSVFAAAGTDQLVSGGLIARTSADIDPNDGIDTGSIHKHLVLQLSNPGDPGMSPAEGVYMIAWQARSVGFETSDPFFFVLRTSTIDNVVRDLAADWVEANIETLIPETLPGDYNFDGVVDAADYVVWRKTGGNQGEYETWREHFGMSSGEGASSDLSLEAGAVPEPGTSWMAVVAMAPACGLARRRKRRRPLIG